MRAVVITEFGVKPLVQDVDEPKPSRDGRQSAPRNFRGWAPAL